jgi:cell wall-associated NlpC family hydrolase
MKLKKFKSLFNSCLFIIIAILATNFSILSQGRVRIVNEEKSKNVEISEPTQTKRILASPIVGKRPELNQNIVVIGETKQPKQQVTPQISSLGNLSNKNFNLRLQQAIDAKIGIPYRYGSTGPSSYDCSGLVWSVFQSAGTVFERTSAGNYWQKFETVSEDEKFKFGTLVFFNKLGHVGIVADENGFYHASSSKGVTYSPFAGYWGKRIVGFRRIPLNAN